MLTKNPSRRWGALVGHAVLLATPTLALAGAAFTSGSATWSWDADTNSANGGKTVFTIAPPSSSALPVNPTYQLNRSGSFGGGTATGKGSVGYVANSTTASWTFSGGSGAAQADPSNALTGDTITKVLFGGLFDVTSPGFGPTATGYFSLTAAGAAGALGSTQIAFDMQWRLNGPSGALLRTAISDGTTFLGGAGGMSFSKTWTYGSAFSPSTISTSDNIWVGGSLTFIADNAGTPSDTAPITFEASAAPPTATFYGLPGNNSNWFDPVTWQVPDNPAAGIFAFTEPNALVPTIPNGIGQRARVVTSNGPSAGEQRGMSLTSPATIGALHIETKGRTTINNAGSTANTLTMDVQSGAGNATIFVGASAGDNDHGIIASVVLADSLDVRVESTNPGSGFGSQFAFGAPITNVGTPKEVNVRGTGAVNYNSANDYQGATNILEKGTLIVNANGGLGTGSVNVFDGNLIINTPMPFQTTGAIVVAPGGQVQLGVGSISGASITFNEDAGFTGDSAVLGATQVNNAVAPITIVPGGYVGHQQFSLAAGDNPQGLGVVPQYIFAISADFLDPADPSITVGSNTTSPWSGFGSDAIRRTYGNSPSDPAGQSVTVDGSGVLFAPTELIMNARLLGAPSASIEVRGGGVVTLNSQFNSYAGNISVSPGATLRVNGQLPAVQTVNVQFGGTIGGEGNIGGDVLVQNGGTVDPGIGPFNNITETLTVNDLTLQSGAILDFEFGTDDDGVQSDQVNVLGTLVLDGSLLINQLQNFDAQGQYTLFTYAGVLIDNGLTISPTSQRIFDVPAELAASILIIPNFSGLGGTVVLAVPEPGSVSALAVAGAILVRRRRQII